MRKRPSCIGKVIFIIAIVVSGVSSLHAEQSDEIIGNQYCVTKDIWVNEYLRKGACFLVTGTVPGRIELTLAEKQGSEYSNRMVYVAPETFVRYTKDSSIKIEKAATPEQRAAMRDDVSYWWILWKDLANRAQEKARHEARAVSAAKKAAQSKYQERVNRGGLVNFSWSAGGFGSVAILNSITISNTSDSPCRDIKGTMRFVAKSGTVLGSHSFVIYDIIAPHKVKTFHNINVGFLPPQSDSCSVSILNCH